ncbi:hypothetical protein GCM10020295_17690 [Streptomyces cinereospinus]
MTRGHGGAGLFSDGKFSFFPSASELWTLPRPADLRAAYDWTCELLGSYGLDTPPFPSDPTAYTVGSGEWILKEYPSDYLSLEARLRLTADMVAATDATVLSETEVLRAEHEPATDVFRLTLCDSKGQESQVLARRLVLASGRFGPPPGPAHPHEGAVVPPPGGRVPYRAAGRQGILQRHEATRPEAAIPRAGRQCGVAYVLRLP